MNTVRLAYHYGCIHISGNRSEGLIKVFDLFGRMAYSGTVVDGIYGLPVPAEGIYLVSYVDKGNAITTQKITIK